MTKPFHYRDARAIRAQKEGYRARSAYKLKDIIKKYPLFRHNDAVLDIGAAPGGWLIVARECVGDGGKVIGVDLEPISPVGPNVHTYQGDIKNAAFVEKAIARHAPFNVIISDAAPNTTGIKERDQARSYELSEHILQLISAHLKPKGNAAVKIFQGSDTKTLLERFKTLFKHAYAYKPPSSRERSFETYLIGIRKR